MNTVVLVKLPKIPLLANKKSQTVDGISSLSQVMGLAAFKLRLVIGSIHGVTLVAEQYHNAESGQPRPKQALYC